MHKLSVFVTSIAIVLIVLGCAPAPPQMSSSDIQRDRQETVLKEGVAQVGVPAIKNFRELKLLKDIYELRDQTGLVTYTYLWNEFNGKWVFLCDSIGYPIPYSAQFTAPTAMQRYTIPASLGYSAYTYGTPVELPQAEPNGIYTPVSAEGTWVMCKDPNSKEVRPSYIEPRVMTFQFKLP